MAKSDTVEYVPNDRELQLEEALQNAKAQLSEQEELLQQLTATPIVQGFVLYIPEEDPLETLYIVTGTGQTLEVNYPHHLDVQLKQGDFVSLSGMTQQIIDISKLAGTTRGELCFVKAVKVEDGVVELDVNGTSRYAFYDPDVFTLERGDRVIADASYSIILSNLGREEEKYKLETSTGVCWDDIGGLVDAKAEMQEALVMPYKFPELYKHYNKEPLKGVLLWGPPGNGKTMLGKAAATELQKLHDENAVSGFLYVKGPEILEKWVGVAEQNVRSLFDRAKKFKEQTGMPAVLFIDEADAILAKRGSGVSSDMEKTIVPMFLAEMDGLGTNNALVILATNRPDTLDPAVVREGRIDRKIRIPRPDKETAAHIFNVHMKNIPVVDETSSVKADMCAQAAEELFDEQNTLYEILLKNQEKVSLTLGSFCSGAMIAGIVDQATSAAMKRDMDNETQTGISHQDLIEAIHALVKTNRSINHDDTVKELIEDFKDDVKKINRVKVAA